MHNTYSLYRLIIVHNISSLHLPGIHCFVFTEKDYQVVSALVFNMVMLGYKNKECRKFDAHINSQKVAVKATFLV